MNRLVIFAALLLIQIVTAATNPHDAAHGVTILQPTSKGNANKGETVMAESSNGAPTECTSETCDKHHSSGSSEASGSSSSGSGSSSSASGGKAMKPVLVAHPHDEQCGCEEQLEQECACRKAKFVAPEIKLPEAACGCLHEEVCGCRGGVHAHREEGVCGCLHLEVCPCRETIAPEQRENTVEPELQEHVFHHDGRDEFFQGRHERREEEACGCLHEEVCGCKEKKPLWVQPEIKAEPCACEHDLLRDCECSHFRRNH